MANESEKTYLSWSDIERYVDKLIERLPGDFDNLLVITRGGMVPACLVSEKLDMRNILVAAVMFYTDVDEKLDEPVFLQFPPDPYLSGRRILVVDDVWDTGKTVMSVRRRIEAAGGQPEVAVIHYKPERSKFPEHEPDYYAKTTGGWIVYPWDPERERI